VLSASVQKRSALAALRQRRRCHPGGRPSPWRSSGEAHGAFQAHREGYTTTSAVVRAFRSEVKMLLSIRRGFSGRGLRRRFQCIVTAHASSPPWRPSF
jgi:hypothetical protein